MFFLVLIALIAAVGLLFRFTGNKTRVLFVVTTVLLFLFIGRKSDLRFEPRPRLHAGTVSASAHPVEILKDETGQPGLSGDMASGHQVRYRFVVAGKPYFMTAKVKDETEARQRMATGPVRITYDPGNPNKNKFLKPSASQRMNVRYWQELFVVLVASVMVALPITLLVAFKLGWLWTRREERLVAMSYTPLPNAQTPRASHAGPIAPEPSLPENDEHPPAVPTVAPEPGVPDAAMGPTTMPSSSDDGAATGQISNSWAAADAAPPIDTPPGNGDGGH